MNAHGDISMDVQRREFHPHATVRPEALHVFGVNKWVTKDARKIFGIFLDWSLSRSHRSG